MKFRLQIKLDINFFFSVFGLPPGFMPRSVNIRCNFLNSTQKLFIFTLDKPCKLCYWCCGLKVVWVFLWVANHTKSTSSFLQGGKLCSSAVDCATRMSKRHITDSLCRWEGCQWRGNMNFVHRGVILMAYTLETNNFIILLWK